ncbi:MAG TPA: DUF4293 domain-containing protein [Bacteroidia bacterium]|nr:DUF4293 domain-containing protein [Bacteroidia bacterium]
MIQRIQSLLLLFALFIAVALYFMPLSQKTHFDPANGDVPVTLKVTGFETAPGQLTIAWPLLICNTAVGILSLIAIFMYRNRPGQIKITMLAFFISCLVLAGTFWYSDYYNNAGDEKSRYLVGVYLLFVQLFVLIRAIKAIKKDEELVRSADRIR